MYLYFSIFFIFLNKIYLYYNITKKWSEILIYKVLNS